MICSESSEKCIRTCWRCLAVENRDGVMSREICVYKVRLNCTAFQADQSQAFKLRDQMRPRLGVSLRLLVQNTSCILHLH